MVSGFIWDPVPRVSEERPFKGQPGASRVLRPAGHLRGARRQTFFFQSLVELLTDWWFWATLFSTGKTNHPQVLNVLDRRWFQFGSHFGESNWTTIELRRPFERRRSSTWFWTSICQLAIKQTWKVTTSYTIYMSSSWKYCNLSFFSPRHAAISRKLWQRRWFAYHMDPEVHLPMLMFTAFFLQPGTCASGDLCQFCHIPHTGARHVADVFLFWCAKGTVLIL